MELVWEDPPTRTAADSPEWKPLLDELRTKPNTWARLKEWEGASTAYSTAKALRKRYDPTLYEFVGRAVEREDGKKISRLYGRYLKEEPKEK